jgi:hypothetical protein
VTIPPFSAAVPETSKDSRRTPLPTAPWNTALPITARFWLSAVVPLTVLPKVIVEPL